VFEDMINDEVMALNVFIPTTLLVQSKVNFSW
jgi:hypothetical protein